MKLAGRTLPVRAQYAVVLAYCGEFAAAEAEMVRLAPYEPGLSSQAQGELRDQRRLIAELKRHGPPPQWEMPPRFAEMILKGIPPNLKPRSQPAWRGKVGRNDPYPCGSGRKSKRCHH